MFNKVLIANRGEIACRVISTLRDLGIASVAVYSRADAGARHVRLADEALYIGEAPPADSYLNQEAIIEAARTSAAEAIHPGYGFLSENAGFARLCEESGLVFIGPQPEAIIAMGSKSESKRIMQQAGVPVVPGFFDAAAGPERLLQEADAIGYPVMIKATAGGGGKGMRLVESAADFPAALEAARREAAGAFGSDEVLLEKYIDSPRHIEFQVFGDEWENAVHLYDRECSLQRRYQKIIEEAPSPFLDDKLRQEMGESAVAAVRALGYRGAGTVEFIVGADRRYYFLEMNTRLQVEHPVTELVTGLDLVEWQLRIAAGEPLPLLQEEISLRGHAIEARLYAEDPRREFLPATGLLERMILAEGSDTRIDKGVEEGDEVTVFYDPMVAKLIAFGNDREHARSRLLHLLRNSSVFGPVTNLHFLELLLRHPAFVEAELDTRFVDRNLDRILGTESSPPLPALVAAAHRWLADEQQDRIARAGADRYSPWLRNDGWRAGGSEARSLLFRDRQGNDLPVRLHCRKDGQYDLESPTPGQRFRVSAQGAEHAVEHEGHETAWRVWCVGRDFQIVGDAERFHLHLIDPLDVESGEDLQEGILTAPMPGKVIKVAARAGDQVERGDLLMIVEAMKMEHRITAPDAGVVAEVFAVEGDFVEADVTLVSFAD